MFTKIKDKASATAAKLFIQSKLGAAGKVQELFIDSRAKKISIQISLAGEPTVIFASVESYSIHQEGKEIFITLGEIKSSRNWIEMLCSAHLSEKKIGIPAVIAKFL
jgi:hypothetical protein